MADMLVNLYENPLIEREIVLKEPTIQIKQALALDKNVICEFVKREFSEICPGWVDECALSILQHPSCCFIAVHDGAVIGFCCYDGTAKGMLGPLGVQEKYRKQGVAMALMQACFQAMKSVGYVYAVIGWVSSENFYRRHCGAILIPNSSPGVYQRLISHSS